MSEISNCSSLFCSSQPSSFCEERSLVVSTLFFTTVFVGGAVLFALGKTGVLSSHAVWAGASLCPLSLIPLAIVCCKKRGEPHSIKKVTIIAAKKTENPPQPTAVNKVNPQDRPQLQDNFVSSELTEVIPPTKSEPVQSQAVEEIKPVVPEDANPQDRPQLEEPVVSSELPESGASSESETEQTTNNESKQEDLSISLRLAFESGEMENFVSLIKKGADCTNPDKENQSVLDLILQSENFPLLKVVLENNPELYETALLKAIQLQKLSVIGALLCKFCELRQKTNISSFINHAFATRNLSIVALLLAFDDGNTTYKALKCKADSFKLGDVFDALCITCKEERKFPSFYEALREGNVAAISLWLKAYHSTKLDISDFFSLITLYESTASSVNNVDKTLGLLHEYGVDLNPLFLKAVEHKNEFCAELLVKRGIKINHQNEKGYSVLHLAAQSTNYPFMLKLLKWGVDPDLVDLDNRKFWQMTHSKAFAHISVSKSIQIVDYKNFLLVLEHAKLSEEKNKYIKEVVKVTPEIVDESTNRYIEVLGKIVQEIQSTYGVA